MEKNAGLLGNLIALGSLQDVNGLWFNQQNITIDGYRFIGCRFDSCKLYVNTTNFELINCHLDSSTNITYGSDVLKVVQLFNTWNEYIYTHAPVFAPRKNLDGTITVRTS